MKTKTLLTLVCLLGLGIVISVMLPDWTDGVKAGSGFSNRTFEGTYAFSNNGTITGIGPTVATGVLSVDGRGNSTGVAYINSLTTGTTVCPDPTPDPGSRANVFGGPYRVRPDGTGSAIATISSGPLAGVSFCVDFALGDVRNGIAHTVHFNQSSPGSFILGVATRQRQAEEDDD